MENIIEMIDVDKIYEQGTARVHALKNINLKIKQYEFVVILGKSGSGKSTLLSLIGGLEQPSKGKILLDGIDLSEKSEDELAMLRRSEIGIVFQHFNLMEAMTAVENVELPLLIAGVPKAKRRPWAINLLKIVGLEGRETHYPNELSGGERQRVGIARALANKSKILIADEPTGDLDSQRGSEIIDLIYNINKGKYQLDGEWRPTVVMVTHDVGMLRPGMRVLRLSDGIIISDEIFDGDYEKFDPFGNPSVVSSIYKE